MTEINPSLVHETRRYEAKIVQGMKDRSYWKAHYIIESNAEEIEKNLKSTFFESGGKVFELIYFEKCKDAPNILISQGSAGHSYVFAELGFLIHLRGYNVFIMPKHGGYTISQLVRRHADALEHISTAFNKTVGVFSEGLGCYAAFYLALAGGPLKSIVCLNGPAILTEEKFQRAIFEGGEGAAGRRKRLLPLITLLAKLFPWLRLRISTYLDFKELVDTHEEDRKIEAHFVKSFNADPDFDKRYPLSAIMSLVSTPPPHHLSALSIPTMFVVPIRGFFPSYFMDLFSRLPQIEKSLVEVDGGVFWMLSHPRNAAKLMCDWFDRTLQYQ
jgi:hypothetical protein